MSTAKRLRRSPEGGYARGDETRHRIIEAAIELFGEHGFEGASTRDIAARAGVNAPALQYYFENKEGVYRACVEALADDAWTTFKPAIEHAQKALGENADTAALIDAFIRIQETIADGAFAKANNPGRHLFFAREQAGHEPESATQILASRIRRPLNDASAALVARICGRAADDPITLIRTFSLHGQLVIFHVAHRATLSVLGWKSIDAQNAELLKSTIRGQTRTLLGTWSRERDAGLAAGAQTHGKGKR
jgi:TetR/AcrR family transcriptional regulator, regulator of cefoperazone and chloramphenicol sensitivity